MDNLTLDNNFIDKTTSEELDIVEKWFLGNSDDPELDARCLAIISRFGAYEDRELSLASWRRYKKRLAMIQSRRNSWLRTATTWAAVIAVCLLSTVLAYQYGMSDSVFGPTEFTLTANVGTEDKVVVLPDSTKVFLHPGSEIIYDAHRFSVYRDVMLIGDAYFDVTKSPDMGPFHVICDNARIEVLGTRFNVCSHRDDSEFQVSLYDGCVRLSSSFADHQYMCTMHSGEIVKVDKTSGVATSMYLEDITDGEPGMLTFVDTPLKDVISKLSRQFGVNIVLRNPELINLKFLSVFDNNEDLNQILDILADSHGLKSKRIPEVNTIEIY